MHKVCIRKNVHIESFVIVKSCSYKLINDSYGDSSVGIKVGKQFCVDFLACLICNDYHKYTCAVCGTILNGGNKNRKENNGV